MDRCRVNSKEDAWFEKRYEVNDIAQFLQYIDPFRVSWTDDFLDELDSSTSAYAIVAMLMCYQKFPYYPILYIPFMTSSRDGYARIPQHPQTQEEMALYEKKMAQALWDSLLEQCDAEELYVQVKDMYLGHVSPSARTTNTEASGAEKIVTPTDPDAYDEKFPPLS